MGSNGDHANWRRSRARLEKAISDAMEAAAVSEDDETGMRRADSLSEILRQASYRAAGLRARFAVRIRKARDLSIAEMGVLMGVGKETAAGILKHGADEDTAPPRKRISLPEGQAIAAAIVTSRRGLLVGKRNDGVPPWTFIAGEIEPGESAEDAAVREVKEETGLLVKLGDEIGRRVHPATGRTVIYISAFPEHGTDIFVGDRAELAEVRWVSYEEAVTLLPGMYLPVRRYISRALLH
jgi:8-oxo-dGTP diphosphatase